MGIQLDINEFEQIELQPIVSPISQALKACGFVAKEGLSINTNCDICEIFLTWKELADHFECEKNSDSLPEHLKHQRDVNENDSRVRGLKCYIKEQKNSVLPSLIIFTNKIIVLNHVEISGKVLCEFILEADAHRIICDGQGRTTCIKSLLREFPELSDRTISIKLINTNTDSIFDASDIIRQVFSDVNGQTKKPDTSLSMYFDSSKPLSCMMRDILTEEIQFEGVGHKIMLRDLVALNGKIKTNQIWTLKQYTDAVLTLFGMSSKELSESLSDSDTYDQTKALAAQFFKQALPNLPYTELMNSDKYSVAHKGAMFTKSLFLKGMAYLGASMFEEGIVNGKINWEALASLKSLPIDRLDSELWINHKVCWVDDSLKSPKTKIYKSSDKKIARILCQYCRVFPSLNI